MKIFGGGKQNWRDVEGAYKLRLDKDKFENVLTIPSYPNRETTLLKRYWLSADANELLKVYNSSLSCAAFIGPFKTIRVKPKNGIAAPLSNKSDTAEIDNEVLYSAIVDAIKWPKCIIKAAESYILSVFHGVKYIAVHWRYDEVDWIKKKCKKNLNNTFLCSLVQMTKPGNIINSINSTLAVNHLNDSYYLYIATPPSLNNFSNDIYSYAKSTNLMYPKINLETYLTKNYKTCWYEIWTNTDEIVSLVEMVIMEKSDIFFYSDGSSWSSNVLINRIKMNEAGFYYKKISFSIIETLLKVMEYGKS